MRRETCCKKIGSSVLSGALGDCDLCEQPAEPLDHLDKLVVRHGLGEVSIAPQGVTLLHLVWVIRRGEHNHRDVLSAGVALQAGQYLHPTTAWQVQVEEHEAWWETSGLLLLLRWKYIIERSLSIA